MKYFIEIAQQHALLTRVFRDVDLVPFFPSPQNLRPSFRTNSKNEPIVTFADDKPFYHVGHSMSVSIENEPEWFSSDEKAIFTSHAVFDGLILLPAYCPELEMMPFLEHDICYH